MSFSIIFFIVIGGTVWIALLRTLGFVDLILGFVVILTGWQISLKVSGFAGPDTPYRSGKAMLLAALYLVRAVLPAIVKGSAEVIWYTLSRHDPVPALFAVHLPGASREALFFISFGISLSPHLQVADLDEEKKIIYVHALHAPQPEKLQREIWSHFERYLKEALP